VYVCSCFGITEQQVRQHADSGRCTPRQIASACKAGTDCGSCVKRIQALLGRGNGCVTRSAPERTTAERVTAQELPAVAEVAALAVAVAVQIPAGLPAVAEAAAAEAPPARAA
jgi:bacterioferritin-associated ferredoxin